MHVLHTDVYCALHTSLSNEDVYIHVTAVNINASRFVVWSQRDYLLHFCIIVCQIYSIYSCIIITCPIQHIVYNLIG